MKSLLLTGREMALWVLQRRAGTTVPNPMQEKYVFSSLGESTHLN